MLTKHLFKTTKEKFKEPEMQQHQLKWPKVSGNFGGKDVNNSLRTQSTSTHNYSHKTIDVLVKRMQDSREKQHSMLFQWLKQVNNNRIDNSTFLSSKTI